MQHLTNVKEQKRIDELLHADLRRLTAMYLLQGALGACTQQSSRAAGLLCMIKRPSLFYLMEDSSCTIFAGSVRFVQNEYARLW